MSDTTSPPVPAAPGRQVRSAGDGDWPAIASVLEHAFGSTLSEEMHALERETTEISRTQVALEDDLVIGTSTLFSFRMSLPGRDGPVAGVSNVAVLPTHRRQGVLGQLMRRMLTGLHEQQAEPVAMLWASEPAIYGRFGFGAASRSLTVTVRRRPGAWATEPADPSLRLRLVDPGASLDEVERVYEAVRARRPGMHVREGIWRRREITDPPGARSGRSELRVVVAADADGPRGYARYQVEERWGPAGPDGTVHVRELMAADAAAEATLLRYVSDLDLTSTAELARRPVDDLSLDLTTDLRGAHPVLRDALYVRIVDLDRALRARSYRDDATVVVEVQDDLCPWNAGRWQLQLDDTGGTCLPTGAPADLTLPIRTLGAAYLGSAGVLERLAWAGQVTEHTPGSLARLSRALSWPVEPWAPFVW